MSSHSNTRRTRTVNVPVRNTDHRMQDYKQCVMDPMRTHIRAEFQLAGLQYAQKMSTQEIQSLARYVLTWLSDAHRNPSQVFKFGVVRALAHAVLCRFPRPSELLRLAHTLDPSQPHSIQKASVLLTTAPASDTPERYAATTKAKEKAKLRPQRVTAASTSTPAGLPDRVHWYEGDSVSSTHAMSKQFNETWGASTPLPVAQRPRTLVRHPGHRHNTGGAESQFSEFADTFHDLTAIHGLLFMWLVPTDQPHVRELRAYASMDMKNPALKAILQQARTRHGLRPVGTAHYSVLYVTPSGRLREE